MPPPPNTTSGTATDISGLFPYTASVTAHDSGTTYDLWYKFTATVSTMIGAWAFGGTVGSGYRPAAFIYGPNSPTMSILSGGNNRPVQFWVEAGSTYYIKFRTSSPTISPAVAAISILEFTQDHFSSGDIIVNDDTKDYPAAIFSSTTGDMLKYLPPGFASGESGAVLDDGTILLDESTDTTLILYDSDFNVIATLSGTPNYAEFGGITCNRTNRFYVTNSNKVWKITNVGVVVGIVANITTVAGTARSIAVSPDETILYYREYPGVDSSIIKRWDLVNDLPLSNLVAAPGGGYNLSSREILCLEDGTIIAAYVNPGVSYYLKRYNADGTTANTYSAPGSYTITDPIRLAYAIDDPTSFWAWFEEDNTSGEAHFLNIKCSDGTILATATTQMYEVGDMLGAETATPYARFGHSESCPFLILRAGDVPTTTTLTVTKVVSGTDATFDFTASDTLSPSTFSLSNGESQTYTSVGPGTYSIIETANLNYSTSYLVSNSDPHTAIVIVEGDHVTVTVTNTLLPDVASGIYKIVPNKRNDTLYVDPSEGTTEVVKIPDPTASFAYIGN